MFSLVSLSLVVCFWLLLLVGSFKPYTLVLITMGASIVTLTSLEFLESLSAYLVLYTFSGDILIVLLVTSLSSHSLKSKSKFYIVMFLVSISFIGTLASFHVSFMLSTSPKWLEVILPFLLLLLAFVAMALPKGSSRSV